MQVYRCIANKRGYRYAVIRWLSGLYNRLFVYRIARDVEALFYREKKRAHFFALCRVKTLFGYRRVVITPSQLKELASLYNNRMDYCIQMSKKFKECTDSNPGSKDAK